MRSDAAGPEVRHLRGCGYALLVATGEASFVAGRPDVRSAARRSARPEGDDGGRWRYHRGESMTARQ